LKKVLLGCEVFLVKKIQMAVSRDKIITPIFTNPTLGGRSSFDYSFVNGSLLLRFGKMTYFIIVKYELIEAVKERIFEMEKLNKEVYKTKTSLYNQPKWEKCPNNKTSVYVACLLIHNKIK